MHKKIVVLGGNNMASLAVATALKQAGEKFEGVDVIDVKDIESLPHEVIEKQFQLSDNFSMFDEKQRDKMKTSYKKRPFLKTKEQLEIEEWNRQVEEKRQKRKHKQLVNRIDKQLRK